MCLFVTTRERPTCWFTDCAFALIAPNRVQILVVDARVRVLLLEHVTDRAREGAEAAEEAALGTRDAAVWGRFRRSGAHFYLKKTKQPKVSGSVCGLHGNLHSN